MISMKTKAPEKTNIRQLAARVNSGDVIWLGSQLAISEDFMDALAERYSELENVTLAAYNLVRPHELLTEDRYKDSFKLVLFRDESGFPTAIKGRPHVSHRLLPDGDYKNSICRELGVNTLVTETLPPDEYGNCNMGIHGRYVTSSIIDCPEIEKKYAITNDMQRPEHPGTEGIKVNVSVFDGICENNHKFVRNTAETYRKTA